MAQSKVTDYYARRKSTAPTQSVKRSARISKLSSAATRQIPTKTAKASLPETLPVKTAAFGDGVGAARNVQLCKNNVDLDSQLRSFNQSPHTDVVGKILSRTFAKNTQKGSKAKSKSEISSENSDKSEIKKNQSSNTHRLTERTPSKRLASDPDVNEPPRRKRTKVVSDDKNEMLNDDIRTPNRSTKKSNTRARKRLEIGNSAVPDGLSDKMEKIAKAVKETSSATQKKSKEKAPENINAVEMKEKLAGCGKLADLQACLALVKGTAAEIKKLQEKTLKVTKEKKVQLEEKPAAPTVVPAFERYRHLIQQGPSALVLPFKYRSLEEAFRCSDTVVSMLHNRVETCTFDKLKHGVQEMSRKNFDLDHLKQMKTVYPTAYELAWSKTQHHFKNTQGKKEPYTLLIEANLAGIPTDPDDSKDPTSCNMTKGLAQPSNSRSGSTMFDKFTPSMLIARRTLFHNGLVDIVKSHHNEYLASLNPPIPPIPDNKLHRWHPKFPLDKIPDVSPSDLPMPEKVTTFNTAKDVLDKARDMMINPKVKKALEIVAKNSELKAAVETKKSEVAEKKPSQPKKTNTALKGVSQDLLERIRAKEAQKSAMTMMRTPQDEKRIGMLERLPELCKILRVFFLAEKKAALPMDTVIQKLMDSYRSSLARDDVEKHIDLMVEVLPEWLKKVHIRKDTYIKMDKTTELSTIFNKVNGLLKDAKKLK